MNFCVSYNNIPKTFWQFKSHTHFGASSEIIPSHALPISSRSSCVAFLSVTHCPSGCFKTCCIDHHTSFSPRATARASESRVHVLTLSAHPISPPAHTAACGGRPARHRPAPHV